MEHKKNRYVRKSRLVCGMFAVGCKSLVSGGFRALCFLCVEVEDVSRGTSEVTGECFVWGSVPRGTFSLFVWYVLGVHGFFLK